MKNTIITIVVVLILGIVGYLIIQSLSKPVEVVQESEPVVTEEPEPVVEEEQEATEEPVDETKTVIGSSVEGRDITAYHYGTGDAELLFVGGIHGGYEWNTVLVAYELMDYLESNPSVVPDNVRVSVIPVLNPDGLQETVGTDGRFTEADAPAELEATIPGRFNANDVDLNRNFDCEWQKTGTWQNRSVSGGGAPFSEPESQALRDYVENNIPAAAVVWYSSAGGVFASNCRNGVSDETLALTNLYASASGYPAYEEFDFYKITGDMVNWLAGSNIPAISVLLTTHEDVELDKNKKGVDALLEYYSE